MKKYLFLAALAVFCCGFIQTENEYEKDLKLTINTHKFGVNNDDVINATLHNVSKQDHKIAYTDLTGGVGGSELYIHFHAFMRSKAGNWEQLTNKIDKTFEFLYLRNKIPVRIKAGKSLDFMTIVFYPKKWFGVGERKGELKIMASYEYKK